KAAKAQQEAGTATANGAPNGAPKDKPQGWFFREKSGAKRPITEVTIPLTISGRDARTEVYCASTTGLEFVSSTRPDLAPLFPSSVNPEKTPEAWALCVKAQPPEPEDLEAHNGAGRTAPPESAPGTNGKHEPEI